jgi:hypothetical protein
VLRKELRPRSLQRGLSPLHAVSANVCEVLRVKGTVPFSCSFCRHA